MKQIKIAMFLIITLITLCACPDNNDEHDYITIMNQYSKAIIWQPRMIKIGAIDTLYNCSYTNFIIAGNFMYNFRYDSRTSWETGLGADWYLQLLLMDSDIFYQNYTAPCDTIRKYVPILHRYQLKLEDLQRMNWTVVYPPEE